MRLLSEYYEVSLNQTQLTEAVNSAPGSPIMLRGIIIQRADAKNRNGRIYPKDVLKREIDKYIENMVDMNRALGELDHSAESVVNLKNVSHNIKSIYWKGNDVVADLEILDAPEFPAGRIAAGLLRRKIPVGISSRGMGSVDEAKDGTVTVNDDFNLLTFDLVSFESTQGANMYLQEGKTISNDRNSKIDSILKELICINAGYCPCD
jgi:hypothetical protein